MKHIKLFEQFSSSEYDRILDLYNEYGEKGMTKEEVLYLKSGGQTEIPKPTEEWKRNLIGVIKRQGELKKEEEHVDITRLTMDEFFDYVYKISPEGTREEFRRVSPLISQYISSDFMRAINPEFKKKLQTLVKRFRK